MKLNQSQEIFSFHLIHSSLLKTLPYLMFPLHKKKIQGLKHSEMLLMMQLGASIISPTRFRANQIAFFACWSEESALEDFLEHSSYRPIFKDGWHVRMKQYRKWGEISELRNTHINSYSPNDKQTIVAVTLARLKLAQTFRFIRFGKPVEQQVRDHPGQNLALAAMRPLNSFSTFSIWKNEDEMTSMVRGQRESHSLAMKERNRKPFHHEFATMRFIPISEFGSWNGKSNYILEI